MTIRDCLFSDNVADGNGGALYLGDSTVENCVFIRNTARTGAALWIEHSMTVRNCTFLANTVTDVSTPGGAVMMDGLPSSERSHLIVAGTVGGAAIDCPDAGEYGCCDFWNNEAGDYSGWLCGVLPSYGDISADPMFCNPAAGDVRLSAGSPCLPGAHGGVECGLMGAKGLGCDLVPVSAMTWGRFKVLYR